MLDIEKLDKEFTKILHSFSADDIQEWLDMDEKRTAFADERWVKMSVAERKSEILASNCGMLLDIALNDGSLDEAPEKQNRMSMAKLNVISPSMVKPRKASIRREKVIVA